MSNWTDSATDRKLRRPGPMDGQQTRRRGHLYSSHANQQKKIPISGSHLWEPEWGYDPRDQLLLRTRIRIWPDDAGVLLDRLRYTGLARRKSPMLWINHYQPYQQQVGNLERPHGVRFPNCRPLQSRGRYQQWGTRGLRRTCPSPGEPTRTNTNESFQLH